MATTETGMKLFSVAVHLFGLFAFLWIAIFLDSGELKGLRILGMVGVLIYASSLARDWYSWRRDPKRENSL